ncbi:hypothetical protein CCP2SC5_780004 [Azospirillaceae bacterium]
MAVIKNEEPSCRRRHIKLNKIVDYLNSSGKTKSHASIIRFVGLIVYFSCFFWEKSPFPEVYLLYLLLTVVPFEHPFFFFVVRDETGGSAISSGGLTPML